MILLVTILDIYKKNKDSKNERKFLNIHNNFYIFRFHFELFKNAKDCSVNAGRKTIMIEDFELVSKIQN